MFLTAEWSPRENTSRVSGIRPVNSDTMDTKLVVSGNGKRGVSIRKVQLGVRVLFILLLVCGISGACTRQGGLQLPPKAVEVKIIVDPEQRAAGFNYEGEFRPQTVSVATGGTVTWNNTDNKDHIVVSYDGNFNKRLQSGESFSYIFTQNGTYKYHDVLYDGMDGIVYVQ